MPSKAWEPLKCTVSENFRESLCLSLWGRLVRGLQEADLEGLAVSRSLDFILRRMEKFFRRKWV